ncbi:MAG: hypothetical protein AABW75_04255 [Nanoarchaeota archaeon]
MVLKNGHFCTTSCVFPYIFHKIEGLFKALNNKVVASSANAKEVLKKAKKISK